MVDLSFEKLLNGDKNLQFEPNVGRGSKGNIDKTACFYHVITNSFNGGNIYNWETANYRHTLLSQQCEKRGIKIIFSLTMPNHTHDVFLTPSWDDLVDVLRTVNSKVSQHLRLSDPKKFKKGVRIIRKYPAYVPVRDIVQLFCLGKYIYDNPSYMKNGIKSAPDACFWMLESDYFVAGYDRKLYTALFGITPKELFQIYRDYNSREVAKYACERFSNWTEEDTKAVFYR